MRKNIFNNYGYRIMLFVAAVFAVAGCSSTPKSGSAATGGTVANYQELGKVIAQARERREEISELHYENANEIPQADKALHNAENIYARGESSLSSADKNTAYKDAQFALAQYDGILNKNLVDIAGQARARSLAAQQEALKLKADVAVRDDYNLTTGIHNQGEAFYRAKDYRKALSSFREATTLYTATAGIAAEKRRQATLALQSAETKIAESEKIAAEAGTQLDSEI